MHGIHSLLNKRSDDPIESSPSSNSRRDRSREEQRIPRKTNTTKNKLAKNGALFDSDKKHISDDQWRNSLSKQGEFCIPLASLK